MYSPLVSVIMPTYKWNKKWIKESIDSVINQTYKNLEFIIISDEPDEDMKSFFCNLLKIKKDSRIVYIENLKKFNIWKALNQWILLSQWKYIARIDDDDIWNDEDKLKKQVEFLESNGDYSLVGVDKLYIIDEEWDTKYIMNMRKSDDEIRNTILQSCQFSHPSIMFRKEILEKSWIYDTSCFTEDYDLWFRIWKFSKFCNIDSSIMYREYKNSLSQRKFSKTRIEAFKVFWKYKKYYPNFLKALIFRIWEFILPDKVKRFILKKFKKNWINN